MSAKRSTLGPRPVLFACLVVALAGAGCSVRRTAVNALGDALAGGTSAWAADDDPELIRDATPFALKTIESLLAESPRHRGLLLAASGGFTQYSYAFVHAEADFVEDTDFERARALRARARRLYLRARDYGLRGLDAAHPGFPAALRRDPAAALAPLTPADVPALYWTAAAWGALISLAKDDGAVAADLPLVGAMLFRAAELDESWGGGSVHDLLLAYEGGRPVAGGGSPERARRHLDRALEISSGRRASPLVGFAETVSVAAQERREFESLLRRALAVDADAAPEFRLANLVAQKRARWLLGRVDELFIE
ncbi:MAG: TRAP transporter TatT component family protein [Acidobacteriota bacterium]